MRLVMAYPKTSWAFTWPVIKPVGLVHRPKKDLRRRRGKKATEGQHRFFKGPTECRSGSLAFKTLSSDEFK